MSKIKLTEKQIIEKAKLTQKWFKSDKGQQALKTVSDHEKKVSEEFDKERRTDPEIFVNNLHLRTKTIVVENSYIDRDYLEDYSSYYVRCFKKYQKACTRFHFFCGAGNGYFVAINQETF